MNKVNIPKEALRLITTGKILSELIQNCRNQDADIGMAILYDIVSGEPSPFCGGYQKSPKESMDKLIQDMGSPKDANVALKRFGHRCMAINVGTIGGLLATCGISRLTNIYENPSDPDKVNMCISLNADVLERVADSLARIQMGASSSSLVGEIFRAEVHVFDRLIVGNLKTPNEFPVMRVRKVLEILQTSVLPRLAIIISRIDPNSGVDRIGLLSDILGLCYGLVAAAYGAKYSDIHEYSEAIDAMANSDPIDGRVSDMVLASGILPLSMDLIEGLSGIVENGPGLSILGKRYVKAIGVAC